MWPPAIDGQILTAARVVQACGALLHTLLADMVAKVCLESAFINACARSWAENCCAVWPFCLFVSDFKSLM